jgi:hypothetical protein
LGEFWYVDKGKLYLQSSARARDIFIKRVDHFVEMAAAYWTQLP